MHATLWNLLCGNHFCKLIELGFILILILNMIVIQKDQTQKISTYSKSTTETLEEGLIFLKLTIMTVQQ